ncbi:cell division protein YceG [Clostridia bacterium]|nr:cell division protein YceG [Clostridia bacterium]
MDNNDDQVKASRKRRFRRSGEGVDWDPQSLKEVRSYGFFWYDWIWRLLRPLLIFTCALLVIGGGVVFAGNTLYRKFVMPVDPADTTRVQFIIESGSSLTSVSRQLETEGLIRNRSVIKYLMDFQGLGQKIQAGVFQLSKSMTLGEIIEQLTTGDGKPLTRNITVIPGWTIETIAKNFAEQGIIPSAEAFIAACKTGDEFAEFYYINELLETPNVNQRKYALEGYLSPNTYEVYLTASVNDIIRKLLGQVAVIFTDPMRERAQTLGMTVDQVVNLASMIEKEGKTKDFAKVSAVFHNRLDRNMRLQSDVTVKYSTGSEKMALDTELNEISGYNTYLNTGLPIGPICNPSKEAIDAALNPDPTFITENYLYFCSKEPGNDELYFSKTLEEHSAAVALYRPLWIEYDRNRGLQ